MILMRFAQRLSRLRRRNRLRAYFGASARAALGIDCAALFSGPVEAAAEAARGSVSLDSMHLRFGGRASRAAIQYVGTSSASAGGRRRVETACAESIRG